jgi:cation:H+ antiporter
MAISDILGTNILNIALISGVDLIAPGGPVLDEAGDFSVLAATLGTVVTGLFMLGLSERADRTYLRMGTDSILVLLVYSAGLYFLFRIREGG